ncbi:dynein axonemal assembly factor 6-like, partial [Corticium candelabrum]|uniref:dynein axonemal assembly factor 6-like n=1 Tax=Corticium candelabrum TaxID=121492 RepID=UPI002E27721C
KAINQNTTHLGKKLGKEKANSKDIWDPDVVQEQASLEDELDSRPAPEYEYLFQQAVSAEEMFLGMGSKNTSTASCENLLVKIKLPGVKYSDVQLDVTDTFLDCRTPHHKLGLPLPHQVDSKNGKAQWDESKNVLTVTLRMIREYDFLQV